MCYADKAILIDCLKFSINLKCIVSDMENFVLIANSGIQYFSSNLEIKMNDDFKVLFHEWFDEEHVQRDLEFAYCLPDSQKVYRWADMIKHIDDLGKLKCKEVEVLANPNLHALEDGVSVDDSDRFYYMRFSNKYCKNIMKSFYNNWIPIPFLELDALHQEKTGPYNWCRCKIIPKTISDELISAQILFAFDTRSLYMDVTEEEFPECPYFESESELKKEFRLCDKKNLLVDFCSSGENWVRTHLMLLAHSVSSLDEVKADEKGNQY